MTTAAAQAVKMTPPAQKYRVTPIYAGHAVVEKFEFFTSAGAYWRTLHTADTVQSAQDMADCFNGVISRDELAKRNLARAKARKAAKQGATS